MNVSGDVKAIPHGLWRREPTFAIATPGVYKSIVQFDIWTSASLAYAMFRSGLDIGSRNGIKGQQPKGKRLPALRRGEMCTHL